MSEQELRDFVDMEPRLLEYSGAIGGTPQYYAQFAVLDDETIAVRILCADHETVASGWAVCGHGHAANILRWAEQTMGQQKGGDAI